MSSLEKEKLDQESDDHTINDNDGGTTTHATNAWSTAEIAPIWWDGIPRYPIF
jgi:hypothetical protein